MADLQTSFNDQRLMEKNLPTLPLALQEALRLAENPKTSLVQLGDVIQRDQVLSGKALKMVNSPTYGFPGRIASIHNALVLLGFNVVKSVLISTVVFENTPTGMKELWRHSTGCSTACKELGKLLKVEDPNELLIAGLLHDIGKVVIAAQLPEAKKEIDRLVREDDIPLREAEKQILGLDHSRVSAWLAERWNLPLSLRSALAHHHHPMNSQNGITAAAIVHVGNFLTKLFEHGSGGDSHVPALDPHAFKHLGLNQQKLGMALDIIGEIFEAG